MSIVLELEEGRGKREEGRGMGDALEVFADEIEVTDELDIIGTAERESGDVFVIRDRSKSEGIDGAYVEVSISEIITRSERMCPRGSAREIISVIRNERKGIVLEGVTRIVGYYSRVTNWNKSKIGELRDRASGNYRLSGGSPEYQVERLEAINSL